MCGCVRDANTPSSSRFSASSFNHSGRCRNRFPDAGTTSLFLFVFLLSVESRDRFPDVGMLVMSLRVVAGFDEVSSDVSWRNDVKTYLHWSWKNLSTILVQRSVQISPCRTGFVCFLVYCGFWPLVHSLVSGYPNCVQFFFIFVDLAMRCVLGRIVRVQTN